MQIKKLATPHLNKISFYVWLYFTIRSVKYVLIISVFFIFLSNLKLYVNLFLKDKIEIELSGALNLSNIVNSFQAQNVLLLNALQNSTPPSKKEMMVTIILRYAFMLIFFYSLKTFRLTTALYGRIGDEWRWAEMKKKKIRFTVYLRFLHKVMSGFIFQDLIGTPFLLPEKIELRCFRFKKIIVFNRVWR